MALGKTLGEIAAMPAAEFLLWQEFAAIEPLPEERADLRHGIAAQLLANIHRGKGRSYTAADFIPWSRPPRDEQAELAAMFGALASRPPKDTR